MKKQIAIIKIQRFLKNKTNFKLNSFEDKYQSLAIKEFVESVIKLNSPIKIKDNKAYIDGQRSQEWLETLSWNQQLSIAQLSTVQKQQLINMISNLSAPKNEVFDLMRDLLGNNKIYFNQIAYKDFKENKISWDTLIKDTYILGHSYVLINMAVRFPEKLIQIMTENMQKLSPEAQKQIENKNLIGLSLSVLQSFSLLLNEAILKNSLPKHKPDCNKVKLFRGISNTTKTSEKIDKLAVGSYSKEKITAKDFSEKPNGILKSIELLESTGCPGNQNEAEVIIPLGYRPSREKSSSITLANLKTKIESTIKVSIGRIPKPLAKKLQDSNFDNEKAFSEFLAIANTFTLNRPYPSRHSNGNHNGMHSLRQLRLLNAIVKQLNPEKQNIYSSFSSQEKFVLNCAAIFLRAGRIDESSHKSGDDWYRRSFIIFSNYMNQLGIHPNIIKWIEPVMCESCKPENAFEDKSFSDTLKTNPKSKLAFDCLNLAHNLDLVRLKDSFEFLNPMQHILNKNSLPQLLKLAKVLLAITGNEYDKDKNKFTENSFNFLEMYNKTAQVLDFFTKKPTLDSQDNKENVVNKKYDFQIDYDVEKFNNNNNYKNNLINHFNFTNFINKLPNKISYNFDKNDYKSCQLVNAI